DQAGTVWIADGRLGVWVVREGVAESVPQLPPEGVYALHAAKGGVLWVGYYNGEILSVRGDSVKRYRQVRKGPLRSLKTDEDGVVWAATEAGLSRFNDDSWASSTAKQGLPDGGLYQLMLDQEHGLWAMSAEGLIHLAPRQLLGFEKSEPLFV